MKKPATPRREPAPQFIFRESDNQYRGDVPEVYWTALMERHQNGKSYARIATDLGVAEGTVKSRINRAREIVRNKRSQAAAQ